MAGKKIELKLDKRTVLGKKCKLLAEENLTPAVIYNRTTKSTPLQVESNTLIKYLKNVSMTTALDLEVDGKKIKALVREVQKHPVTDQIIHISFQEIDPDRKMRFDVPIELSGVSPAVKNNLGTLILVKDTIEVRCSLNELPESIVVDISGMKDVGNTIQIKEISLPDKLELVRSEDEDLTLVTVSELEKEIVIEETVASTEAEEGEEGEEGETADGEGVEGEKAETEGAEEKSSEEKPAE